jgi:hypothetical protein
MMHLLCFHACPSHYASLSTLRFKSKREELNLSPSFCSCLNRMVSLSYLKSEFPLKWSDHFFFRKGECSPSLCINRWVKWSLTLYKQVRKLSCRVSTVLWITTCFKESMHQFQLSFSWSKLWSLIQFFKIEKKHLIEITCRLDFTFDNKHFRISTQTSKITLLETIKTSFMYMVIFHFEMACWICELNTCP